MDDIRLSCSIYNTQLDEMILKKKEAKNDEEKLWIMTEFAERFTMLPDQWKEFLELSKECNKEVPSTASLHIHTTSDGDRCTKNIEWSNSEYIISQLNDYKSTDRFLLAEDALSFPHSHFDAIYERYCYNLVRPMAREWVATIRKNRNLYEQIKASEDDIDEWIECMKEVDNKEAVIANMELKLGQNANWTDKKIWHFYINFLNDNNMKEILEVYRKYTRLFISDKEAVEDYRNLIDKFSMWNVPTTKYWNDTIQHELDFGDLESAYRILKRALIAVLGKRYHFVIMDKNDLLEKMKSFGVEMSEYENLRNSTMDSEQKVEEIKTRKPTVYFQNPTLQYSCFRRNFLLHLLKNANGYVLRKLYSTCKFFHGLKRSPLCFRLEVCDDKETSYCQESLYINEKDTGFAGLENLHVFFGIATGYTSDRNAISRILTKVKQCTLRHMIIQKQDLSFADFYFMLSPYIGQISLYDVNIHHRNGEEIEPAEIFKIVKDYPSLFSVEFINQKHFILSSAFQLERVNQFKMLSESFQFETIHIDNQMCVITDLQALIDYQRLKKFILKNTVVQDENGNVMGKKHLEELIKTAVNPVNNIFIEIV